MQFYTAQTGLGSLMSCSQQYDGYTEQDFETWKFLLQRQNELILKKASRGLLAGIHALGIEVDRIVAIKELSDRLFDISGWNVIGVDGLLPNDVFFNLLNGKVFPVSVHIRSREELEFSRLPDLFHDVYGHVSLLTNNDFCDYIYAYSMVASKYIDNPQAIAYLGRLYWFTLETGLIREDGMIKPYGGAILSSSSEIENVFNPAVPKHKFDIQRVMLTSYDNLLLQKEYFVIESFEQLFDCIKGVDRIIDDLLLNVAI